MIHNDILKQQCFHIYSYTLNIVKAFLIDKIVSERALLVVGVTRLALLQRTLFVVYQNAQRSSFANSQIILAMLWNRCTNLVDQ